MGPWLIWPRIAIGINMVFAEITVWKGVMNIMSSERVIRL